MMGLGVFDFLEVISAFIVLFAVIDIIGSIPIIIDLRDKGNSKCILSSFFVFCFDGCFFLWGRDDS